jgi:hypothetical protein
MRHKILKIKLDSKEENIENYLYKKKWGISSKIEKIKRQAKFKPNPVFFFKDNFNGSL